MKLSWKSLQDFFSIKKPSSQETQLPHEQLLNFPGIIAAKVISAEKHPNADRLRIIKLDAGTGIIEPVVCGAFNFEAGDTVALALPGAHIAKNIHAAGHESFTLGKAKIRGVESQGMICAAFELGLAEEPGQGILLLKPGTVAGSQFSISMIK